MALNKSADKYVYAKLTVAGDYFELNRYKNAIYAEGDRFGDAPERNPENDKRIDNINRSIRTIRNLIYANLTPHSKFVTLTYSDTVLDISVFEKDFKNFLKSMSYYGYKLRYIYVIERQTERGEKEGNEGCIHAHLVVFNDEKIPLDVIRKSWKHGRTEFRVVNGIRGKSHERVNNVAAYITKYFTKEGFFEFGRHSYRCSLGLNKPDETKLYVYGVPSERFWATDPYSEDDKKVTEFLHRCKVLDSNSYPLYDSNGVKVNQIYSLKGKVLSDE